MAFSQAADVVKSKVDHKRATKVATIGVIVSFQQNDTVA
jgi:hypothetical protein